MEIDNLQLQLLHADLVTELELRDTKFILCRSEMRDDATAFLVFTAPVKRCTFQLDDFPLAHMHLPLSPILRCFVPFDRLLEAGCANYPVRSTRIGLSDNLLYPYHP